MMNLKEVTKNMKWSVPLAYCDYIGMVLRRSLVEDAKSPMTYVKNVSGVHMDLHETEGYLLSTSKTIVVEDMNGKHYKVTIEEMKND